MSLIRPFPGLRPTKGHAEDVAAPPYDVLNSDEARQRVDGKPWSFLHISKPEIDMPAGTNVYDEAVYQKGAENLRHMVAEGILKQDQSDHFYVYKLVMGEHTQVGLVTIASVADYDTNRIRKHEYTRPDKEDDRVRNIDTLNAQTGPVFLTYKHSDEVDQIIEAVQQQAPEVDIVADDGVSHTLWVMQDAQKIHRISELFDAMDCLYIADGHHRSAAASRVAAKRQQGGDGAADYFLSVIFPDNQMQILDYNRVITDLNGLSAESFVAAVSEAFTVTPSDAAVRPTTTGEFGMYLANQWYKLTIDNDKIPQNDPVASLDVSLLADYLIEPILDISDPRRDKRIDFVGGIRGLAELEKRVNSGEMAVAFSFFPTTIEQLMSVADANEVMPPKSTWFEPKLADGLVSHLLD